jgi:hypothetical protein
MDRTSLYLLPDFPLATAVCFPRCPFPVYLQTLSFVADAMAIYQLRFGLICEQSDPSFHTRLWRNTLIMEGVGLLVYLPFLALAMYK